jgi:hypothetical protein
MMNTRPNILPFLTLSQVNQESEPPIEQKCMPCRGDGVLPIYDYFGKQCGTTPCPVCGGSRYAS